MSTRRRPTRSLYGPQKSMDRAKSSRKQLMLRLDRASVVSSEAAMLGRAGRYMSVDRGAKALRKAR